MTDNHERLGATSKAVLAAVELLGTATPAQVVGHVGKTIDTARAVCRGRNHVLALSRLPVSKYRDWRRADPKSPRWTAQRLAKLGRYLIVFATLRTLRRRGYLKTVERGVYVVNRD